MIQKIAEIGGAKIGIEGKTSDSAAAAVDALDERLGSAPSSLSARGLAAGKAKPKALPEGLEAVEGRGHIRRLRIRLYSM